MKFNTEKIVKSLSCLCASLWGLCNSRSLTHLINGLDCHGWSEYEDEGIDFKICDNLKITLYSQINPKSDLKVVLNRTEGSYGAFKWQRRIGAAFPAWCIRDTRCKLKLIYYYANFPIGEL